MLNWSIHSSAALNFVIGLVKLLSWPRDKMFPFLKDRLEFFISGRLCAMVQKPLACLSSHSCWKFWYHHHIDSVYLIPISLDNSNRRSHFPGNWLSLSVNSSKSIYIKKMVAEVVAVSEKLAHYYYYYSVESPDSKHLVELSWMFQN